MREINIFKKKTLNFFSFSFFNNSRTWSDTILFWGCSFNFKCECRFICVFNCDNFLYNLVKRSFDKMSLSFFRIKKRKLKNKRKGKVKELSDKKNKGKLLRKLKTVSGSTVTIFLVDLFRKK